VHSHALTGVRHPRTGLPYRRHRPTTHRRFRVRVRAPLRPVA
jgi:hypothetical protein